MMSDISSCGGSSLARSVASWNRCMSARQLGVVGKKVWCSWQKRGKKSLGVLKNEIKRLELGQLGIEPRTPNLKGWCSTN